MKGSCITMYGFVLRKKYGADGISKADVMDLFNMLDSTSLSNQTFCMTKIERRLDTFDEL